MALALIAGLAGVVGPVPIGRVMSRLGERPCLIATGIALVCTDVLAWFIMRAALDGGATGAMRAGFIGVLVVMGLGAQVWGLGRQSYLGTQLPPSMRARGMSTFGGMTRLGGVVGPILGAAVSAVGHPNWVYALEAVALSAATILVATCMLPLAFTSESENENEAGSEARSADVEGRPVDSPIAARADTVTPAVRRAPVRTMLIVAAAMTPLTMGRTSRPVILPLLGAAMGLDAPTISLIFGIASLIEITLFIPTGILMDRYGRTAVVVPCLSIMSVGYLLLGILALVMPDAGTSTATAILSLGAGLIAIGNGFGAGIIMTLGIDLSPLEARTRYLARWNSLIGVGTLLGPALVSILTAILSVAASAVATGALCVAGATGALRVLPQATPVPARGPFSRRPPA